jgi:predicted nicotinamide N-methyase
MKFIIRNTEYNFNFPENDDMTPETFWTVPWTTIPEIVKVFDTLDGNNKTAIELGCGLGIPSLAATLAGYTVTATDYIVEATTWTKNNILAHTNVTVQTEVLDFTNIPDTHVKYDMVIACDVLYKDDYQIAMCNAINKLLKTNGVAYIADSHRRSILPFINACKKAQLNIHIKRRSEYPTITVYEITKSI